MHSRVSGWAARCGRHATSRSPPSPLTAAPTAKVHHRPLECGCPAAPWRTLSEETRSNLVRRNGARLTSKAAAPCTALRLSAIVTPPGLVCLAHITSRQHVADVLHTGSSRTGGRRPGRRVGMRLLHRCVSDLLAAVPAAAFGTLCSSLQLLGVSAVLGAVARACRSKMSGSCCSCPVGM